MAVIFHSISFFLLLLLHHFCVLFAQCARHCLSQQCCYHNNRQRNPTICLLHFNEKRERKNTHSIDNKQQEIPNQLSMKRVPQSGNEHAINAFFHANIGLCRTTKKKHTHTSDCCLFMKMNSKKMIESKTIELPLLA